MRKLGLVAIALMAFVPTAIGLVIIGRMVGTIPSDSTIYDCIWFGEGRAYVDENRNDEWDSGEVALEGVEFYVDDVYNKKVKVSHMTSNAKGIAEPGVWLPGCPKTEFEVYVEVPDGYGLSGVGRKKGGVAGETLYQFGFWPVR